MFNVLPDILKEEIAHEYKFRRLLVVAFLVLFVEIFSLTLFFPSWIVSKYREQDAVQVMNEINESPTAKSTHSVSNVISSTNAKLRILNTQLEYPKIIPLLEALSANKIPAIHIQHALFDYSNASALQVTLEGVADTRESLVIFLKNLHTTPTFKVISSPISNLTKDKNIEFSIYITLAP